jgi:hypothetical protein
MKISSFLNYIFGTSVGVGVSTFGGNGSNFLFKPILHFSLFTSITSNSISSHSFTISATFTTLIAASFEI